MEWIVNRDFDLCRSSHIRSGKVFFIQEQTDPSGLRVCEDTLQDMQCGWHCWATLWLHEERFWQPLLQRFGLKQRGSHIGPNVVQQPTNQEHCERLCNESSLVFLGFPTGNGEDEHARCQTRVQGGSTKKLSSNKLNYIVVGVIISSNHWVRY